MRFRRRNTPRGDFDVVVTSMLDINFLLIMFFMMTAHFQIASHAEMDLPTERGDENAEVDEAGLVINLTRDGEIIIANHTVALAELRELVRSEVKAAEEADEGRLKLMVRADRQAGTDDLNEVVSLLRATGVGTIRIATEVPM